jgi:hypothetical protein
MAHTPFQMAFKPEGNLFTWYGEPSNAGRLARFNAAMKGSLNASPMNILKGKLYLVLRFGDFGFDNFQLSIGIRLLMASSLTLEAEPDLARSC